MLIILIGIVGKANYSQTVPYEYSSGAFTPQQGCSICAAST